MTFASLDLLDSLTILLCSLLPFHGASTRAVYPPPIEQNPALMGRASRAFFAVKQRENQKQDCQRKQDVANRPRVEDPEIDARNEQRLAQRSFHHRREN